MPRISLSRDTVTFRKAHTLTTTIAIVFVLLAAIGQGAQAQTFTVLHTFTGGADGGAPYAGLAIDRSGNLYGTASIGGDTSACGDVGCGVVFRFAQKNSNWILTPLYTFRGGADGGSPEAPVLVAPDGTLYGTAFGGSGNACNGSGCGVVFHLVPPARASGSALGGWNETVLYTFQGGSDGAEPGGILLMDAAGNIYGSTSQGGTNNDGVVYRLTPANGSWTETVLYSFTGGSDGAYPSGVIMDAAGNLYGEAGSGGLYGYGTVFELSQSGSQWIETTLHSFTAQGDGRSPSGGLISDPNGYLIGTTSEPGTLDTSGTIFTLTPSQGQWNFYTSYQFQGEPPSCVAGPSLDAAGNIWATLVIGNAPNGQIWGPGVQFPLTNADGILPYSRVTFDAAGNAYGTTSAGGPSWPPDGTIWQLTP